MHGKDGGGIARMEIDEDGGSRCCAMAMMENRGYGIGVNAIWERRGVYLGQERVSV